MGGHGHLDPSPPPLRVGRAARIAVVAVIVVSGLAAALGVLHWWPDAASVDHLRGALPRTAAGVRVVRASLVTVRPTCTTGRSTPQHPCGPSTARVLDGSRSGPTVAVDLTPDVLATGLRAGDRVLLDDLTGTAGATADSGFAFDRAERGPPLLWLAVLFALCVLLVARLRGLTALLGLAVAGAIVVGYLLPALLSGRPAVPVTAAAAVLILIVLLYATHGISLRTSVALVGALVGVGLSTLYAELAVVGAHLGGLGGDPATLLVTNAPSIDVQQLVAASVILAGLGTLNDVTVTQASALWELRAAAPAASRLELFRRAMRIGRDHIASSVYTLVFAYLGTALVLVVAVQLFGGTPVDFVTSDDVATEVVRTLVGGVALVLAMPATTLIGALVVSSGRSAAPTG